MVHLSGDCTVYPKVLVTINGFCSRILPLFHNTDYVRLYFGGVEEGAAAEGLDNLAIKIFKNGI